MPGKHRARKCRSRVHYATAAEAGRASDALPVYLCPMCGGFHHGTSANPVIAQHAVERLQERYGLVADYREWLEAHTAIEAGEAQASNGSREWRITLAGAEVRAVYDPLARLIVTVLPPSS